MSKATHIPAIMGLALVFVVCTETALSASYIDLGQIDKTGANLNLAESYELLDDEEANDGTGSAIGGPDSTLTLDESSYRQRGRLLGVFSISYSVVTVTYADGRFETRSPWYAFLVAGKRIETGTGK